jgi:hypothetical protein
LVRLSTDPVGEIFLKKPTNLFNPHPQPLSQLWERGAKQGRINVSRIRQQHLQLNITKYFLGQRISVLLKLQTSLIKVYKNLI